jgi:hypothetical protein
VLGSYATIDPQISHRLRGFRRGGFRRGGGGSSLLPPEKTRLIHIRTPALH